MKDLAQDFDRQWLLSESKLRGFARQLAVDLDDAEDLLQTSRLKAWKGFGAFELQASFATWVLRIMRNAWTDVGKYRSVRPPCDSLDVPSVEYVNTSAAEVVPDPRCNITKTVLSELAVCDIFESISDPGERLLLDLKICGFVEDEIAQMLKVKTGTVKSRYNRLRIRLREEISAVYP